MNRNHGARWAAYATLFAVGFINLLSYADMSADAPSRAHDDALRYIAGDFHEAPAVTDWPYNYGKKTEPGNE